MSILPSTVTKMVHPSGQPTLCTLMSGIEVVAARPQKHRRRIFMHHLHRSANQHDLLVRGMPVPWDSAIRRDLLKNRDRPLIGIAVDDRTGGAGWEARECHELELVLVYAGRVS